jgi:hypothetical protein
LNWQFARPIRRNFRHPRSSFNGGKKACLPFL